MAAEVERLAAHVATAVAVAEALTGASVSLFRAPVEDVHGPGAEHGHMHCAACGESWEIPAAAADRIVGALAEADGFQVDVSHVTVVGRCRACARSAGG